MVGQIVIMMVLIVFITGMFMFVLQNMKKSTNQFQDKIQSALQEQEETTSKDSTVQDKNIKTNTQNDIQKQEQKITQEPKVIIKEVPVTKEVQVVKEVQVPAKNSEGQSFLNSVGSNIIAELVVAVLISVVTWFIKDYLHLKKKRKLNMNKD